MSSARRATVRASSVTPSRPGLVRCVPSPRDVATERAIEDLNAIGIVDDGDDADDGRAVREAVAHEGRVELARIQALFDVHAEMPTSATLAALLKELRMFGLTVRAVGGLS